jgi:ArsR family transcriptional regulator, arsenate/arsenite/antimonite-responsive transcriptional repressor
MEMINAVEQLSALAQETRLEVFRLLVKSGHGGLPAGEIGRTVDLPLPTLSFHLRHLREAGLVSSRREGRSIIYIANYDAMNDLVGFLGENCCVGVDVAFAKLNAGAEAGKGEIQ